jgi:hypothetical protein
VGTLNECKRKRQEWNTNSNLHNVKGRFNVALLSFVVVVFFLLLCLTNGREEERV